MRLPLSQAKPFLGASYLEQAGRAAGLTPNMVREIVDFAGRIAVDEAALSFFWYCHYRVLNDPSLVQSWEEPWPPLDDYLGPEAGLLNVLVMLSAVPEMQAIHRRLGIPAGIVRDTVSDLRLWMETDLYYHRDRRWGITPWIARWLCKHWQGKLLQLGRLQFSLSTFEGQLRAYRHRATGAVLAIAEPGVRFCADGTAWAACCGEDPGGWISTCETSADAVVGNPILPTGLARRETRRLDLGEWDIALAPGDDMLTFHVPAGVSLSFEDCGESFRRALEVFPRHYPEFVFRGFWTSSWLMDTRLQSLLSTEANIVRLQRETYAYPGLQGDNQQIYHRVFGWGVTDIHRVPWVTSLQKAVGKYLENGGHFHGGYGFLLREDFAWGEQVYLRRPALA